MRIWIDMTAPAHPLVFRPIIPRLRAAGHEVLVTARDYADTLGLLRMHGIEHEAFGRHGGASRTRKLSQLVSRSREMRRWERGRGVHAVVLPRTPQQRAEVEQLDLPSLVLPDGPIDAQSLIALADLVVSAGGTMNREAVALGTPVYTTYAARLGGVDEALMREGRLRPLTNPRAVELVKKGGYSEQRTRRDPQRLIDTALEVVEG